MGETRTQVPSLAIALARLARLGFLSRMSL